MATGFGLAFGLIAGRLTMGGAFWAGIFYSIVIWALMTYLVLPALDPIMRARVALAPTWWFGHHLIYGAVLSLKARSHTGLPQTINRRVRKISKRIRRRQINTNGSAGFRESRVGDRRSASVQWLAHRAEANIH
jgi:hypothetical protein